MSIDDIYAQIDTLQAQYNENPDATIADKILNLQEQLIQHQEPEVTIKYEPELPPKLAQKKEQEYLEKIESQTSDDVKWRNIAKHCELEIITKSGERRVTIDNQKLAGYIRHKYQTISTGGDIWIYNETGAYSKDIGEINSIITNTIKQLDSQKQTDNITQIRSMLLGSNFYPESPFNYNLGYIPFRNGYVIIDFETETIHGPYSHSPDNKFTYVLPVDYIPEAPTGPVIEVLKQWVPEEDVPILYQIPAQGFIQAMIDNTYKKSYLIQGERDSGKSSYLELLYRAFGKKNGALSLVSLHGVASNPFELAELEDKVLNAYDELESEELTMWGQFKKLTGSTHHQIQRKYRDPRNARIFCVHVFACNIPPMVPERAKYDPAFWGRWEFIRFPFSHENDPTWHDRTYTPEFISGFFNLVMRHMMKIYNERKLVINHSEEEVMEKWFQNGDPLCQFLDENTSDVDVFGKPATKLQKYSKTKLYLLYKEYCEETNIDARRIIPSIEKFTRDIQKYGFLPRQERITIKNSTTGKVERTGRVWCYVTTRLWNGGTAQVEPTLGELD